MFENNTTAAPLIPNDFDIGNADQVNEYFAVLERDFPQIVEAVKVMGISYQQYLIAMRSLTQQSSFSTSSIRMA
jgi:hypothetical protein